MVGDTVVAEGFEAWAQAEVARLRAEADLLEALLARYRGSNGNPVPSPAPTGLRRNAPLLLALEDAGADGLALGDVVAAAERCGLALRRAAVRSFLWNQVRAGRLALRGDRYVAARHAGETTASAPVGGEAGPEEDGGDAPP